MQINSDSGTGRSLNLVTNSYTNVLLPFLALEFDVINVFDLTYFKKSNKNEFYTMGLDFTGKDFLILYDANSFLNDPNIFELFYQS